MPKQLAYPLCRGRRRSAFIRIAGEGWYQEEGRAAVGLSAGVVISIPANVKHWHGAKADSWFSHIAVEVPGEKTSNEWFEPVVDNIYKCL